MSTKKLTAAELMSLIAERAPSLIAAGVTSMQIDGFSVTLSKPEMSNLPLPKAEPIAQAHINPMKDHSTYANGRVPGFTREEDLE